MNILPLPTVPRRRSFGPALVLAVLVAAMSAPDPALAQARAAPLPLAQDPGYVTLDLAPVVGHGDPTVEVNLDGPLLALVSESMRDEDGDFAQLLAGLRSIHVEIYDLDEGSAASVGRRIRALSDGLAKKGWQSVVRVRDDEEQVHILVRTSGDAVAGLTALFAEPGKSVGFINIVGNFDPARLGRLARQLDLGPLSALGRTGGGSGDEASDDAKAPDDAKSKAETEDSGDAP